MVLVSYLLDNYISILQTKINHREGHEARRIGLEAMPLHQHIEGRHGERQSGVERCPHAMHGLLEMADHSEHREHRLHQHTILPRAALTEFAIAGIARRSMEGGIAQDDHASVERSN